MFHCCLPLVLPVIHKQRFGWFNKSRNMNVKPLYRPFDLYESLSSLKRWLSAFLLVSLTWFCCRTKGKQKQKLKNSTPTLEQWHFILLLLLLQRKIIIVIISISALVSAASPPNSCVNLPCIDHVSSEEVKLSLWARYYIATAYRADLSQRDEDGFHIKSTSHRCSSHLKCTSLLRAAHSSLPDRVFVYFLPCHFPKRHS